MITNFRNRLVLLAMGTLLVACTEPTRPVPFPSAGNSSTGPSSTSSRSDGNTLNDLEAIPRFEITLSVDGSLKPGVPVRVAYGATARLGTARAVLELQAPDVQLARSTDWRNARPKPRQQVAPLGRMVASAAANATLRQSTVLTFEKPGFYRLIATAAAPEEGPLAAGGYVNNFAYKEIWVLISERGGEVFPEFDHRVFGDSLQVAPGPFRLRARAQADAGSTGTTAKRSLIPSAGPSLTTIPNTINGYVLYYDPSVSQYLPLVNVSINSQEWDSYEARYYGGPGSSTDENGYFEMGCPADGNMLELSISLHGSFAYVGSGVITGNQIWSWDCASGADGGFTLSGSWAESAFAYQEITNTAVSAYSLYGVTRDQVVVRFVDTGTSYYEKSQPWGPTGYADRITLSRAGGIFGSWGKFTIAHEYGHAMQHRRFGDYPSSINCPSPHYLYGDEDMTCAYVEGFADYFAVATRGSVTGFDGTVEGNGWYPGGDGSRVEGAVSAFLYDVTDPANEAHDTMAYPGSYLRTVMTSCSVFKSGTWFHAYRISHLIDCMENSLSPTAQSFFPTDGGWTAYTESATEPSGWSASAIRTNWRKNLFGI